MNMKFYLTILFATLAMTMEAQGLIPKRFELLPSDLLARKEPRVSQKQSKDCAVIRVDIVGVKDMEFEEAEGQTKYSMNEYLLYVPAGTQSITYKSGSKKGKIVFADYGPEEVEGKSTYRLMIDTENKMRSAVFYVTPVNAKLEVGDKRVSLDNNGTGTIDLPVGSYSYTVTANNYETGIGTVTLSEDEIISVKDIFLNQKKYNVEVNCNQPQAAIFIDDVSYGTINDIQNNVQLTTGKHDVRITLENYDDYIGTIDVKAESTSLNVNLRPKKRNIVKMVNETSKSSISLRSHIDQYGSWHFVLNDTTSIVKYDAEFHQYKGYFAVKEGFSMGLAFGTDNFCEKMDGNYYEVKTDAEHKNKVAFYFDLPLQVGFALPLSRYNTSHVAFLAGGYWGFYYIGHSAKNTKSNETVETYTADFGLRANITFYIRRFALNFEASRSFSKHDLGTFVGVHIGARLYKFKEK